MKGSVNRNFVLLVASVVCMCSSTALAGGPLAVSLSVGKSVVGVGEQITVSYSVRPGLADNAWIGIVPSQVPHGSEAVNDEHDLDYKYLEGKTEGSFTFTAPSAPGNYDFRFHSTDDNGVELAFVSFVVGDGGPRGSANEASSGGASLRINRTEFREGESIKVRFTAPANFADDAWIGIIPAHVAHGSESDNDGENVAYQYIHRQTSGEMVFTAPGPGRWDFRLHDTDNDGREITYVTFTVY